MQSSVVCTLLNDILLSGLLWERLGLDLSKRFVSLDVVYVLFQFTVDCCCCSIVYRYRAHTWGQHYYVCVCVECTIVPLHRTLGELVPRMCSFWPVEGVLRPGSLTGPRPFVKKTFGTVDLMTLVNFVYLLTNKLFLFFRPPVKMHSYCNIWKRSFIKYGNCMHMFPSRGKSLPQVWPIWAGLFTASGILAVVCAAKYQRQ